MAKGHRSQIKKARNAIKDTRPKAHHNYARLSDRKARIVLEQIKGKDLATAYATLAYSPRYASDLILKVLKSAAANAENNQGLDLANLYVEEVIANQAPTIKRIKPRAQGRAYRINKRQCHITIVLNEKK